MEIPSSSDKLVTVFGGSGFLGRHVVRALAKRGYRIRVAVRRPDLAGHLQPLGAVGQIKAIQANLRYRWSVDRAVEGADAVVNLVGILARERAADLRRRAGLRAARHRRGGPGRRHLRRSSTSRRSAPTRPPTSAISAPRPRARPAVREAMPDGGDHAALDRVRAGGRFLQPLRRHGAVLAGAAADRRRHDPLPAGLRRRCRRGDRPRRRRRRPPRRTIYELGGPEVLTFRECMERMLAVTRRQRAARADALRRRQVAWAACWQKLPGALLTSTRSGCWDRQRRLRRGEGRRADARRARHRADRARRGPADLSPPLPRAGRVQPRSRLLSMIPKSGFRFSGRIMLR